MSVSVQDWLVHALTYEGNGSIVAELVFGFPLVPRLGSLRGDTYMWLLKEASLSFW